MCDQDAKLPLAQLFETPSASTAAVGSRRHKLWELPANTHCPVIGVCLPLGLLRKLVNKGVRGEALADDYEIHVGAVAECACRNRLSHLLQDALDQRFAPDLQRFKAARSSAAVLDMWRAAVASGDTAGAFWAALTHPRSDFRLQDMVLREMHMIQHQVGAVRRVDAARYQALQNERSALHAQMEEQNQRHARALAAKVTELAQTDELLAAARAEVVAQQERIDALESAVEELRSTVPQLDSRLRLSQRLEERSETIADLRRQLAAAQAQLERQASAPAPACEFASIQEPVPQAVQLTNKLLLCVGGRPGCVANYRGMTEEAGARFAHHDGGDEQGVAMLEANLDAADLVICQTGCISHHAYWRVKEHCKRTGKQCVYVDNPSNASFSRGLRQIAVETMSA